MCQGNGYFRDQKLAFLAANFHKKNLAKKLILKRTRLKPFKKDQKDPGHWSL